MNTYREAASLLPISLCGELLVLPSVLQNNAEELRLRAGRPISVLADGKEYTIAREHIVSSEDLYSVLEKATFASLHSVENELARGYITVGSGIRIGICGTAVYKSGKLSGINNFSSMAIRIPRDIEGCSREICAELNKDGLKNVLIISPPGYGKTTFLRDYIRCISNMGTRVSVIDERCELSAAIDGEAVYDLGNSTDIMSGAAKAEAAMMLLRAMNPQVLAMDEISELEDIRAISAVSGCGVKLLATAHAADTNDLRRRPIYRDMLQLGIFDFAVIISKNGDGREYIIEELR